MQPFQEDSYRATFQAEVVAQQGAWVQLSESYFYPTSGGQPHDTGVLESAARQAEVSDVQYRDAQVWHRLRGEPFAVGTSLSGTLDWARRYRHMQRHSAQHLLSQVFVQLNPVFETRSVSLLGAVCTLDLSGNPQDDDLRHAEVLVNRAGYANHMVRAFEIDERDLGSYPLRRPPQVSGRIRLVQMGDFELSACGGTHLRRTGEALPIKITKRERVKGELTRVSFMAGWEAFDDLRTKHESVAKLALEFSAQPGEVLGRVEALRLELSATKRVLALSRHRLAQGLAERLRNESGGQAVVYQLPAKDADLLASLAQLLASYEGTVALLGTVRGDRAQLLFARHETASGDMQDTLQVALTRLNGRGGGSAARAQGSGDAFGLAEALSAAAKELS